MNVLKTGVLLVIVMLLTVPWWYEGTPQSTGVPDWALYSIGTSVVVVLSIAAFSQKIWNVMSGEDDE